MKNSKRIVLSLLLSFAAVPVWAISISCDQNLQFGTIIAPVSAAAANATISINQDAVTLSGAANNIGNLLPANSVNASNTPQRAKCTVTGAMGDYFKISPIPTNGVIIYQIPSPNYIQIPTNSNSTTFFIGGILDLQNAASGSNNQNFSVMVTTCTYDSQNSSCT